MLSIKPGSIQYFLHKVVPVDTGLFVLNLLGSSVFFVILVWFLSTEMPKDQYEIDY